MLLNFKLLFHRVPHKTLPYPVTHSCPLEVSSDLNYFMLAACAGGFDFGDFSQFTQTVYKGPAGNEYIEHLKRNVCIVYAGSETPLLHREHCFPSY